MWQGLCIDMCMNMCMSMCMDMYTDMCMDMFMGMYMEMCTDISTASNRVGKIVHHRVSNSMLSENSKFSREFRPSLLLIAATCVLQHCCKTAALFQSHMFCRDEGAKREPQMSRNVEFRENQRNVSPSTQWLALSFGFSKI